MFSCLLSQGTDQELLVTGYRRSWTRTVVSLVVSVLLAGVPCLVGRWRPRWRLLATSYQCALREATRILVYNTESLDVSIEDVVEEEVDREFPGEYSERVEPVGEVRDTSSLLSPNRAEVFRYFTHRHLR